MPNEITEPAVVLKRSAPIAVFLAVLTVILFARSLHYQFLNYDDDLYVYNNIAVTHGLSVPTIKYAITKGDNGTWAPLTWLSYESDTTLFGVEPSSYRLTNIVLHGLTGAVLFLALRLLLNSVSASFVIAALFLFHPLRNESVVWISERKDVLFGFFWVLGMLAYWFYGQRPGFVRWLLVMLCFVCGCMSKMMMVTFPFALLLLDIWPMNRLSLEARKPGDLWKLIREKLPMVLFIIPVILFNTLKLNALGTLNHENAGLLTKALRVPVNYCFYLEKMFWPTHLSILYPINHVTIAVSDLCSLLLLAITATAVRQMRKAPWFFVGWFWFLGTMIPVIGFVTFGFFYVGDRYTYIPCIGLLIMVVFGLECLLKRSPMANAAVLMALIISCALALEADMPRWKDSYTLFDSALKIGPHQVAYNNRGAALLNKNDPLQAIPDFDMAIQMNTNYADAYDNRGTANVNLQKFQEALEDYNHSITLSSNVAVYYNNRAADYYFLKDYPLAKQDVDTCRRLGMPPHPGLEEDIDTAMKSAP